LAGERSGDDQYQAGDHALDVAESAVLQKQYHEDVSRSQKNSGKKRQTE
jgi:hypothetical protein